MSHVREIRGLLEGVLEAVARLEMKVDALAAGMVPGEKAPKGRKERGAREGASASGNAEGGKK